MNCYNIRAKLNNEVYPQVLREVEHGVSTSLTRQLTMVNTSIEEEIATQQTALEKAMEDVRIRKKEEQERREELSAGLQADLDRVALLRQELE